MERSTVELLIGYGLLIALASAAGGWLPSLIRLTHTRMQLMISLVGGMMLGIGLFHMLPHGVRELGSVDGAVFWMMLGILTMFFLLRAFHFHDHAVAEVEVDGADEGHHAESHTHHATKGTDKTASPQQHSPSHHSHHGGEERNPVSSLGWMGIALGLSLHTLIDGAALAASVQADAGHGATWWFFGLGTFLAVLLHKPLDAVSITSLMTAGGWPRGWRIGVNFTFALMCPLGMLLFSLGLKHFSGVQSEVVGGALAFSAGVFVCIALSDLLPEMEFHSHSRIPLTAALLTGIALAWALRFLDSEHTHVKEVQQSDKVTK